MDENGKNGKNGKKNIDKQQQQQELKQPKRRRRRTRWIGLIFFIAIGCTILTVIPMTILLSYHSLNQKGKELEYMNNVPFLSSSSSSSSNNDGKKIVNINPNKKLPKQQQQQEQEQRNGGKQKQADEDKEHMLIQREIQAHKNRAGLGKQDSSEQRQTGDERRHEQIIQQDGKEREGVHNNQSKGETRTKLDVNLSSSDSGRSTNYTTKDKIHTINNNDDSSDHAKTSSANVIIKTDSNVSNGIRITSGTRNNTDGISNATMTVKTVMNNATTVTDADETTSRTPIIATIDVPYFEWIMKQLENNHDGGYIDDVLCHGCRHMSFCGHNIMELVRKRQEQEQNIPSRDTTPTTTITNRNNNPNVSTSKNYYDSKFTNNSTDVDELLLLQQRLVDAANEIALKHPDVCHRCNPKSCSFLEKRYWTYDTLYITTTKARTTTMPSPPKNVNVVVDNDNVMNDIADDTSMTIANVDTTKNKVLTTSTTTPRTVTHFLTSVPTREYRLHPSAFSNFTEYVSKEENVYPNRLHLFEYNPSIVLLPTRNNNTNGAATKSEQQRHRNDNDDNGKQPYYLASYRLSHYNLCFETYQRMKLYGGNWSTFQSMPTTDYLGIALLDEDLNIIVDTVVTLQKEEIMKENYETMQRKRRNMTMTTTTTTSETNNRQVHDKNNDDFASLLDKFNQINQKLHNISMEETTMFTTSSSSSSSFKKVGTNRVDERLSRYPRDIHLIDYRLFTLQNQIYLSIGTRIAPIHIRWDGHRSTSSFLSPLPTLPPIPITPEQIEAEQKQQQQQQSTSNATSNFPKMNATWVKLLPVFRNKDDDYYKNFNYNINDPNNVFTDNDDDVSNQQNRKRKDEKQQDKEKETTRIPPLEVYVRNYASCPAYGQKEKKAKNLQYFVDEYNNKQQIVVDFYPKASMVHDIRPVNVHEKCPTMKEQKQRVQRIRQEQEEQQTKKNNNDNGGKQKSSSSSSSSSFHYLRPGMEEQKDHRTIVPSFGTIDELFYPQFSNLVTDDRGSACCIRIQRPKQQKQPQKQANEKKEKQTTKKITEKVVEGQINASKTTIDTENLINENGDAGDAYPYYLVGVSHPKTPFPGKTLPAGVTPNTYFSRFFAFEPVPPYTIVARSGKFCLGDVNRGRYNTDNDKNRQQEQDRHQQDAGTTTGTNETSTRTTTTAYTKAKFGFPPMYLAGMSPSKYCSRIHFVTGITEHATDPNKIILGYGVSDCLSQFMELSKQHIANMLWREEDL